MPRPRKQGEISRKNPVNLLPPTNPSSIPQTASAQYAQIHQSLKSKKQPRLGWRSAQGVDPNDEIFTSPIERGEAHELAVENGEGYFDDDGVYHDIDALGEVGRCCDSEFAGANRFAPLAGNENEVPMFTHCLKRRSPMMQRFKV